MGAANAPEEADSESRPLRERYDEAAQALLEVARHDGHFTEPQVWPRSPEPGTAVVLADLQRQADLVRAVHAGTPGRRDARLAEAHARYCQATPAYHLANRLYAHLQGRFVAQQEGDARAFLQLYQTVYLEALGQEGLIGPDDGEAALVQLRVARIPLSHAHAVAEKLPPEAPADDPRYRTGYSVDLDGHAHVGSLRELLAWIAAQVVALLAAGELLAIRYNTFSNFVWFGVSVWKTVVEAELILGEGGTRVPVEIRPGLEKQVAAAKQMLLKFLQAHLEDPAQIRPREFWYGQEYSYLTRDMIDLAHGLVTAGARAARAAGLGWQPELPPLLAGRADGRFLEYRGVGRRTQLPTWRRRWRLLRWIMLLRRTGRRKEQLRALPPAERLRRAWQETGRWAEGSLRSFGIQVDVIFDPHFAAGAADLGLSDPGRGILFLPTHQSLLDHPVMNYVLQRPEFLQAIGWREPVPCAMLARAMLFAPATIRLGKRRWSLIGLSPEAVDRQFEEVDGHVIMEHGRDSGNPTQRFAKILEQRPGVVYGAGTTSAYDLQCLPMQHGLFAQVPPHVIIVPLSFRGIHSLWPKCPKGNVQVNPGRVEVVVCPPMLGETTLLPRRRALRTQLEPASLFQAVHIAALYDPAPRRTEEKPQ